MRKFNTNRFRPQRHRQVDPHQDDLQVGPGKLLPFLKSYLFSGQLIIPNHITMLSVEQEVEGDDTLVIDSVLACDTKRTAILEEEKTLQQKINE